jgi:hypothetical protein
MPPKDAANPHSGGAGSSWAEPSLDSGTASADTSIGDTAKPNSSKSFWSFMSRMNTALTTEVPQQKALASSSSRRGKPEITPDQRLAFAMASSEVDAASRERKENREKLAQLLASSERAEERYLRAMEAEVLAAAQFVANNK